MTDRACAAPVAPPCERGQRYRSFQSRGDGDGGRRRYEHRLRRRGTEIDGRLNAGRGAPLRG